MRSSRIPETAPVPSLRDSVRYFVRIVVLVRPYWRPMVHSFVLSLIAATLGLITPYFAKLYFDNVYPARDVRRMR